MSFKFIKCALAGLALTTMAAPVFAQDLKLWTLNFQNQTANDAFNAIVKQFEADNPGVTISVETRAPDAHKAALRVAEGSSEAPDMFFSWAGIGLGGEYVKAGLSLPLDKYYKQYGWDKEFIPASLVFADQYGNGKQGLPYTFKGLALYYNKALFAKAGISQPPTTFQELMDDSAKLKTAGIPAFVMGGVEYWYIMRLMDSLLETECGAQTHDALNALTASWRTEPCVNKAFEDLHTIGTQYFLSPFMGLNEEQSFELFVAGRAAMVLEGDWLTSQLRDAKAQDIGFFPFPTGTGRLYGFSEYFYISSKSKYPDLAAKFLNYLQSADVQQKYLGQFGASSVNVNVKYNFSDPLDTQWIKTFNQYKATYIVGEMAMPLDVTTEYSRIFAQVVSNQLDPDKAGAAMQDFIDHRSK